LPFVRRALLAIPIALLFAEVSAAPADGKAGIEFFENKIRPILVDHCVKCHSSKKKSPKAGLVLDTKEGWMRGGDSGAAIVPGKPDKSLLIEVVRYQNPDLQMPPKKKLSDAQIADLVRWVEIGAPDPRSKHARGDKPANPSDEFDLEKRRREGWCWQPIGDPATPKVREDAWAKDDIDRFILARLEARGLSPSSDADRRTLIRRLSFDLTGLPPTPKEIDAFLADESPNAVADLVDRLLASPHFGEHWGQHWLDLVRFAETRGHEQDYAIPEAWRYRDYVVRSLNADVPYDQWLVEHVAGDLVDSPRLDPDNGNNQSIQGTGFWHLGEATHSPVDIRGDEADRVHNQIDVFSKTFLGLSLGCARCHDHKFDPISQRDYYALFGYLQSSSFQLADVSDPRKQAAAAKKIDDLEEATVSALEKSFADAKRAQLERFPAYLVAAVSALEAGPLAAADRAKAEAAEKKKANAGKPIEGEIVFEDFESKTYRGWTAEGTAFGDRPNTQRTLPRYQGRVRAKGKRFVNSHVVLEGGKKKASDAHTGTLTSREFEIRHAFINFLIGGGSHKEKTCLELLVDGKVVRTQPGFNSNKMRPATFDVADLVGKKARLRIADRVTAGWGNVGVDHIVFSSTPAVGEVAKKPVEPKSVEAPDAMRARFEVVAKARGLDAGVLERVAGALRDAENDLESPLYALARIALSKEGKTEDVLETLRERASASEAALAKQQVTTSIKEGERNYKPSKRPWTEEDIIFDYGKLEAADWIPSAYRFGKGPRRTGDILIGSAENPIASVVTHGYADSLRRSTRFSGFLRTPTFEVRADHVWFRTRGDCQAFISIDSHRVVHGPLHGVMRQNKKGDGDKWKWHSVPLRDYLGHRIHLEFTAGRNFALERVVFADRPLPEVHELNEHIARWLEASESAQLEALAKSFAATVRASVEAFASGRLDSSASGRSHAELIDWLAKNAGLFESSPSHDRQMAQSVRAYHDEKRAAEGSIPGGIRALALLDGSSEDEPLHVRGNHRNLTKEPVPRSTLTVLRKPAEKVDPSKRGSGRLALAEKLIQRDNPLVARVLVNRVWHHLFGRGIVRSVDDFGVMGDEPTHPDLLEHLATSFVEDGWSLKKLIRRVVLSSTYRQSSRPNAKGTELDPENILLYRARIRRLNAESIRDKILAVSGRLDRKLYGKSVMVHITPFMRGNRSPRGSGPLDGNGRRSIYTEVRRNHLSSMLLAFDKPIPFSTIGRRSLSNAPAQPLILLNDPLVHQQAQIWANRLLKDHSGASDAERLGIAYLEAFGRPRRAAESKALLAFLDTQAAEYEGTNRESAWIDLCHTLFNVKEFIFLD